MKITDDPRIIASQPAPRAAVGLRAARPFGLLARPAGTAPGGAGRAALDFAQRSLAPLRYRQQELTWLDSFRLGRAPSRIQPWRRRPAAPDQAGLDQPAILAETVEAAGDSAPSPLPLVRAPLAAGAGRLARTVAARLAAAKTGQPGRAQPRSADDDPASSAVDPPALPALSPIDHPASLSATDRTQGSGSSAPLSLIQPLRSWPALNRADVRGIDGTVQRAGQSATPEAGSGGVQARPAPSEPSQGTAGVGAGRTAFVDRQEPDWLDPLEWPAVASRTEAVVRRMPLIRLPLLEQHPSAAFAQPAAHIETAAPPLVADPRTVPAQRFSSSATNLESSPASTFIARMIAPAPTDLTTPRRPASQNQGAISRAWAGAAAAQPAHPLWPALNGSADLVPAVPAAGSGVTTPALPTNAVAAWIQPLRPRPTSGAQSLSVINRQRRQPAEPLRETSEAAQNDRPDERPGAARAIRRAAETQPVTGERPGPASPAATDAADQAARREQLAQTTAVPPASIGLISGDPAARPSIKGETAKTALILRQPLIADPAARSGIEGRTAKTAQILRQPLIFTRAEPSQTAGVPPTILRHSGFISRLTESWRAPAARARPQAAAGSAPTAGEAGMPRVPSSRLPLISPIQRSELAASSAAGGEYAPRGTAPWRADGRTGARGASALSSADIGHINRLGDSIAPAPARPRDGNAPLDIPLANRSWPALMRRVDPASFGAGSAGIFAVAAAPLAWLAPIGQAEDSAPDPQGRVRRSITPITASSALLAGDFTASARPAGDDQRGALPSQGGGRSAQRTTGYAWPPDGPRQEWTPASGAVLARSILSGAGALAGHDFGAAASGRSARPASQLGLGQTWLRPLQQHIAASGRLDRGMSSAAAPGAGPTYGMRKITSANREIRRSADWTTAGPPVSADPTLPGQSPRATGGPGQVADFAGRQAAQSPLLTLLARAPAASTDQRSAQPDSIPASLPDLGAVGRATSAPPSLIQSTRLGGVLSPATTIGAAGQIDQRLAERPTGGMAQTWLTASRATLTPLAFIQPARLGGALARRYAEQIGSAPASRVAQASAARATGSRPMTGSYSPAAPLRQIQPARLAGTGSAQPGLPRAEGLDRPWPVHQRAAATPLGLIQPRRGQRSAAPSDWPTSLHPPGGHPSQSQWRGAGGEVDYPRSPSDFAHTPLIQSARLALLHDGGRATVATPLAGAARVRRFPSVAGLDQPRSYFDGAATPALALIQPARLHSHVAPRDSLISLPAGGFPPLRDHPSQSQWRGAGDEAGRSRSPGDAAHTQPIQPARPLAQLDLVQPARLALLHDGGRATAATPLAGVDRVRRFPSVAGLDQPQSKSGGAATPALALIQPARLHSHVAPRNSLISLPAGGFPPLRDHPSPSQWRGAGGEVGRSRSPGDAAHIQPIQPAGELTWMAPLARSSAPGVAAQSLASSLIHRFSAEDAGSAQPAALELLRPGAEQAQPGGAVGGRGAQAAPSLDLLQPMREAQAAPPLQRVLEEGEAANGASAAAQPEADIEALARQVYARLRRRLKIDAERLGH